MCYSHLWWWWLWWWLFWDQVSDLSPSWCETLSKADTHNLYPPAFPFQVWGSRWTLPCLATLAICTMYGSFMFSVFTVFIVDLNLQNLPTFQHWCHLVEVAAILFSTSVTLTPAGPSLDQKVLALSCLVSFTYCPWDLSMRHAVHLLCLRSDHAVAARCQNVLALKADASLYVCSAYLAYWLTVDLQPSCLSLLEYWECRPLLPHPVLTTYWQVPVSTQICSCIWLYCRWCFCRVTISLSTMPCASSLTHQH